MTRGNNGFELFYPSHSKLKNRKIVPEFLGTDSVSEKKDVFLPWLGVIMGCHSLNPFSLFSLDCLPCGSNDWSLSWIATDNPVSMLFADMTLPSSICILRKPVSWLSASKTKAVPTVWNLEIVYSWNRSESSLLCSGSIIRPKLVTWTSDSPFSVNTKLPMFSNKKSWLASVGACKVKSWRQFQKKKCVE